MERIITNRDVDRGHGSAVSLQVGRTVGVEKGTAARHVGATRRVAPTRWATHRVAPTRTGTRWWGLGHGLWGARHTVPRPLWATRRVAPTRWATHRVAPTRTSTRWWGDGWDTVRHGGTVCGGTACRAPTIVGDPSGRPYTMGNPTRWAMRCDGRCAPARGGGGWGAACRGTACRAPTTMGDPPGRPDAMGDAVQWATRTGMPWCGDGWDTVRPVGVWQDGQGSAVPLL